MSTTIPNRPLLAAMTACALAFGSDGLASQGDRLLHEESGRAAVAVRRALEDVATGQGDLAPLTVTYDDIHGLHGGLRLRIHGTGVVEQSAVREPAGKPRQVSRDHLNRLVALLVTHTAWEQREPERAPLPDESRATLSIRYGSHSVRIWEWHRDLARNGRIGVILAFMKQIAWKKY